MQDVCITQDVKQVWALARLGRRHGALLRAAEAMAAATAADFQPQALVRPSLLRRQRRVIAQVHS